MRILLTGAAGRLGRQLYPRLRQQGYFIRALARRSTPGLQRTDELVIEELNPQSDFASLLADIDLLIHLADGFNAFEHLPATAFNNDASSRVQTTKALTKAAAKAGVRLIYLSTIKTMCGTHADEILTEKTAPRPQSLYGRLKLNAEQDILAAAKQYGCRAIILRFPVVFGLGQGSMESLLQLLDSSLPLPFKGLANRRSLISSESLIGAIMVIVKQQTTRSGTYLVHDGAQSIDDMTSLIREGLGRPNRQFKLPSLVWSVLEKLPTLGLMAQRFAHPLELDDNYFRKTYDWHPRKPLQEKILEWAQKEEEKQEE